MNTVYFDTPGLLDIRAITTFGLSVKENDNPIGYFGTGFKYAIAILMRNRANLTISNSAGEVHHFTTQTQVFREKEFDAIYVDGTREMPFTTELGKTWKMWMAFRELYCNTKDEGGITHIGDDDRREIFPTWTRLTVDDKDFYEAYSNRGEYFIEHLTPIAVNTGIEIFNRPATTMFYKRICVGDLRQPSVMTYNYMRFLDLTEDRTVAHQYMWDQAITGAVARCENQDIIRSFVLAPADTYEANAVFSEYVTHVSDEFKAVMKPIAHDLSGRVNSSAQDLYHKFAKKTGEGFVFVELTKVQEKMFTVAAKVCTDLGHDVSAADVHFVQSLGSGVLGTVKGIKIFIAVETFDMGTKMLAGTLMEELIHLEKGIGDGSRALQNFLVNRIMSLYEENTGEPL